MTNDTKTPPGPPFQKPDSVLPQAREHFLKFFAERWAAVTPPMRPSADELEVYEKALLEAKPKDGATALILGATPELRSLTLKHGLQTVGSDIDENVWEALTTLRTVGGHEGFIHGNWLNLPETQQYDFIFGDCIFAMLSWEEMQTLAAKVRALLKHDGFSIQRIQGVPETLTLETIPRAIESYRQDGIKIPLFFYLIFLGEALRNLYHPEMNNREFFEAFVVQHLTPHEVTILRPALVDRKFGYAPWTDMRALLTRHFTVVREDKCTGVGTWDTACMFVLKKKL